MIVAELIAALQKLPPDVEVLVNDNQGGEVYDIEQVDLLFDKFYPGQVVFQPGCVMLQVNV
jgi:hypothetical protein